MVDPYYCLGMGFSGVKKDTRTVKICAPAVCSEYVAAETI